MDENGRGQGRRGRRRPRRQNNDRNGGQNQPKRNQPERNFMRGRGTRRLNNEPRGFTGPISVNILIENCRNMDGPNLAKFCLSNQG